MLFAVFFWGCKNYAQDTDASLHLIPWRTAQGKFGYADSAGKMLISPQFDDAQLFQNGFAVVGKAGKYGVINTAGKFVIPMKYPFVQINAHGRFTVAVLKKEHNAWWQFWHWKMLPEWSILGGNSGPFMVTKVPRAKWSVVSLPDQKTLFAQRRMDDKDIWGTSQYWKKGWQPDRTPPDNISISSTDSLIAVSNAVFRLDKNNKLKKINARFQYFTARNEMMIQTGGNRYQIINEKGKPVNHTVYSKENYLIVRDGHHTPISISKSDNSMPNYPVISALLLNNAGQYFLPPDFKTPFPSVIQDYKSSADTLAASEILNQAVMINAIPNSTDFLVASGAGHDTSGGWNGFILGKDGSWNTKIPLMRGIKEMLDDGRIVFDSKKNKGILDTNNIFYSMPVDYIAPCRNHHFWYMGKDSASGNYGIYDTKNKRWQVAPKYSSLQDEIAPDIAIYTIIKKDPVFVQKEWYGLININDNKEITPPVYDRIYSDGRVLKSTGKGQISFYIDPETGEELRDK